MKMYRAVPQATFKDSTVYKRHASRRTPTNVPFLVDNIWEWLRPDGAPSRRHSAYASPTPELALANASAAGTDPSLYVVCEIVVSGQDGDEKFKLAHLKVTDARRHDDISAIIRHVAAAHGSGFSNLSLALKSAHAGLYLPTVSKEEMEAYFQSSDEAARLGRELRELSTFWKDASWTPQEHDGELFFELAPGTSYQLQPLP